MKLNLIELNIFSKNKKYKEVNRYRFNKNMCDILITGEEQICDKLHYILNNIEFEIFGKDQQSVPLINDFTAGIDDNFTVSIRGAKENVKKFITALKSNKEYQEILNK